jgi:hypothetical protein
MINPPEEMEHWHPDSEIEEKGLPGYNFKNCRFAPITYPNMPVRLSESVYPARFRMVSEESAGFSQNPYWKGILETYGNRQREMRRLRQLSRRLHHGGHLPGRGRKVGGEPGRVRGVQYLLPGFAE